MTPCEYDALLLKQEPPRTLPLEKLVTQTDDTRPIITREALRNVLDALRERHNRW